MHDVLIVGAGPAGLAAAIAASKSDLDYLVLEKGLLVNSLVLFPTNMVFFTTPELLEIGGIPFTSPYEKPTRQEALQYYRKVTDTFRLAIEFGESVTAVRRVDGGFEVEARRGDGTTRVHRTRTVVVAIGAYDHPNRIGVPGEDLPHVSHYYTEAHLGYRKSVVVVGGKNSAAEAALELFRAGATVTLVHRGEALGSGIKYWVKPDIENRILEGSIAARFRTTLVEIRPDAVVVACDGRTESLPADLVLLMTGYRPDLDLLAKAGVTIDEATGTPKHDAMTFETNVPGLYLAGAVVAGTRSGRVFIENGRLHGEMVIEAIGKRLTVEKC
jgi:thioredoxin reductase (NADPH)